MVNEEVVRITPYDWRRRLALLWIGCLVVTGLGVISENLIIRIAAVFAVITGFIIAIYGFLKYWRCPVCGKLLPSNRFLIVSECPHCGYKL